MSTMTTEPIDRISVAETLWAVIGHYKEQEPERKLNIIENPSVGTLATDDHVCALITYTLGSMLKHCLSNKTTDDRIRVICTQHDSTTYKLEVTGAGALIDWFDTIGQKRFGEWATEIGCTLSLDDVEGEGPVVKLLFTVPVI